MYFIHLHQTTNQVLSTTSESYKVSKIMHLAAFLFIMQSISCNAIINNDLKSAILKLQNTKLNMQQVRKDLDKMSRSECDDFIFEI